MAYAKKNTLAIKNRVVFIRLIVILLVMIGIGRLFFIQFFMGDRLVEEAESLQVKEEVIMPTRGVIYDRNGKELAVSITAESIGIYPERFRANEDLPKAIELIAEKMGLEKAIIEGKISSEKSFEWLKRKVDFETAQAIKGLGYKGIAYIKEPQRYYPNGKLAANIIGFAGIDNQGLEGIEKYYDEELSGIPGDKLARFDALGHEIPQEVYDFNQPVNGFDIYLTIDKTIQYFAERELDALMDSEIAPDKASITIIDPNTGEILAMASRPTYDPNEFSDSQPDFWRNLPITDIYEPGSTFKIITAAAAIEEGVVGPEDEFYSPGYIRVGNTKINCWRYYNPHGQQTFREVMQNSCNPGFVEVGLKLEEKKEGIFYDYIRAFGYGKTTDVGMAGEAKGLMIPEAQLKPINIATISIGQGISVTPLQNIRAIAAIANDGVLMQPRIVKMITNEEKELVEEFLPNPIREVVSLETAQTVAEILESVVSEGTGRRAYIPGYRVGGKTGTAQKVGVEGEYKGKYQPGSFVASFAGIAPVNDPQIAAIIVIDEPKGKEYQGGQIAAPIFKKVVEDSLRYLGVVSQISSKDVEVVEMEEQTKEFIVPDLHHLSRDQVTELMKFFDISFKIEEVVETPLPEQKKQDIDPGEELEYVEPVSLMKEVVVSQTPTGFQSISEDDTLIIQLGWIEEGEVASGIVMPNLIGLRIKDVVEISNIFGVKFEADGHGRVIEQMPLPGEALPQEEAISVILSEEEDLFVDNLFSEMDT